MKKLQNSYYYIIFLHIWQTGGNFLLGNVPVKYFNTPCRITKSRSSLIYTKLSLPTLPISFENELPILLFANIEGQDLTL